MNRVSTRLQQSLCILKSVGNFAFLDFLLHSQEPLLFITLISIICLLCLRNIMYESIPAVPILHPGHTGGFDS